ncbi:Mechanosensitive ion channel family protein [Zostera marina]|uniref:Mechanosensitive ion channel family protein n=1 Tax=Zostera marina TaxID=29655 RepID=A0A0K9Q2D8_ZOSMR|nr:Mechanosensitive ion channel family protein [Zostera marina]
MDEVPRGSRSRKSVVLNKVTRLLISLLVGSVIWLVKTLLVKLLASSFHVNRFFERIQESVFNQYVLQTLLGPPVMELGKNVVEFAKKGKQISFKRKRSKRCGGREEQEGKIDVGKLNQMRREKVNAWTMKGLMSVISSGFLTISNVIDDDRKDEEITNEVEAKGVGYRIFKNVAKPQSRYIEEEDLLRFLSRQEVDMVFPLFEGASETGKIRKKSLKKWVVNAYVERKSLAHSLDDTKTAVKQVHRLASSIVAVLIIVISLLLMGFATLQILLLLSSQLVLVAFMFGNTCKTVFEAIIFVFVMHPYDVGDRCVIDGVQMIVEEMNILNTVFLRFDNEKIYYPNAVLSTKPISNFFRSPDMQDSVNFSIGFFTSVEKIATFKSRIKSYLESKPMLWHPNHSVVIKDMEDVNKISMTLYVVHTMNYQNIAEKNSRRTELMLELKKIFEDVSIGYTLLPQDVNLNVVSTPPFPNIF